MKEFINNTDIYNKGLHKFYVESNMFRYNYYFENNYTITDIIIPRIISISIYLIHPSYISYILRSILYLKIYLISLYL